MTTTATEIRDDLDAIASALNPQYALLSPEMKAFFCTVIGTAVSHYQPSSEGVAYPWDESGHTGTPEALAGFDADGAATYAATGGTLVFSGGELNIADNVALPGVQAFIVPIGTMAQRPTTGTVGMLRWSTDSGSLSGEFECWDPEASDWVPVLTDGNYAGIIDTFVTSRAFSAAPVTTKGDIAIYKGPGGSPAGAGAARLPVGTDGYVLTADSSLPHGLKWAASGFALTDGDKGDITVSASGTTFTIDGSAVTFGKFQGINAQRLVGQNKGIGFTSVEEIDVGGGLEFATPPTPTLRIGAFGGDVTKTAGGTTLTIPSGTVTLAKMADIATDRLIGRDTAGTGAPEALTVGGGIEFTGSGGIQSSAYTGNVTKAAGGTVLTIPSLAVTLAMFADTGLVSLASVDDSGSDFVPYTTGVGTWSFISTTAGGRAAMGVTGAANRMFYWTGAGTTSTLTTTAAGRDVLTLAPAAADIPYFNTTGTASTFASTTPGRGIVGGSYIANDVPYMTSGSAAAGFSSTAGGRAAVGVTYAADKGVYWTSASAATTFDLTAGGRAGLGLTYAADRGVYWTSASAAAVYTFTAFARTILDDAADSDVRTTIGLVAGGSGDIWVEKAGDTMTGPLVFAAGTATAASWSKMQSGTVLTAAEAGAIEFDGASFYYTAQTTSGRTVSADEHIFRLVANGGAIGPTIADFFGATSSISLPASSMWELEAVLYFTKTTAGIVTFTITNSAANYTNIAAFYELTPVAGLGTNGASTSAGIVTTTTAAAALPATPSLTTGVSFCAVIRASIEMNAAGNIRIRATEVGAGSTITPLRGSYYKIRRIPGNVGTFAA